MADGPGTQRIHGAVRATQERRNTRNVVEVLQTLEVILGINGLHRDEFGGEPSLILIGSYGSVLSAE